MIKTFHPAILLFAGFFCIQAFSAEPALMSQIRKKYNSKSSIHARFDLRIWWSIREKENNRSGDLYLASGNKFRVEMGDETVVSDGKVYWQYNRKSGQVIIKNLQDIDPASLPSQLLSSYFTKYTYTEKERSGTETVLAWDGDSLSSTPYVSIGVKVETKSGIIKQLKLTDKNDNVNTYTFKKTDFTAIPDKVFKFEVPDDAQVFDSRE